MESTAPAAAPPGGGVEARRQRGAARMAADAGVDLATASGPSAAAQDAPTEPGTCSQQVAQSRLHLQTLLASCAHELAEARAAGDAREAAYLREQAARNQRLRKAVEDRDAARARTTAALDDSRTRLAGLSAPEEVLAELRTQQEACASENAVKVSQLADLTRDVKLQDEVFEKELDKQGVDTQSILKFASVHFTSLRDAFAQEAQKIERSLQQERSEFLSAQQAEIDELLKLRNESERVAAEAAAERIIVHQDALRAQRAKGIAQCHSLSIDVDDRIQALEQRLASAHASHQLAADQLGVRAHKLADKDSDNTALGQQLKRNIAKQREALMMNKERWAEAEKALRDEYAKLKDDYTRSLTQFQQLDAKHEVLEAADARRREEVALNDGELLQELSSSCLAAVVQLEQLTSVPIDGTTPAPELLADIANAITTLVEAEEFGDADGTLRLLDTLNVAVNSQRKALDARQAVVADITALRKGAAQRTQGASLCSTR